MCSPHFYECVDSDNASHFIAYEFYCPTGTVFDNILLVCNYPWLVSVSINSKWASPLQVSSFGPSSSPKILSFLREKWDSFLCIFSLEVANKKTTTFFSLDRLSLYMCVYVPYMLGHNLMLSLVLLVYLECNVMNGSPLLTYALFHFLGMQ